MATFTYISGLLAVANFVAERTSVLGASPTQAEERLIVETLARTVDPFWLEGVDWFERENLSVGDAISCRQDLNNACVAITREILKRRASAADSSSLCIADSHDQLAIRGI